MERRRGVLGARFRMRLMLVFLLMAVAPSVLLMVVGSDLIQQTVDRWFNVDVERILSSSQALGTALRESVAERSRACTPRLLAREIARRAGCSTRRRRAGCARTGRVARARAAASTCVNVFTAGGRAAGGDEPAAAAVAAAGGRSGEALAEAALRRAARPRPPCRSPAASWLRVGGARPRRRRRGAGAVVVSTLPAAGQVAADAREVQERYAKFRKARGVQGADQGRLPARSTCSPACCILFGAVWLSLYLARRITTPLRLVAEGAERIAAGERGVRVDFPPATTSSPRLIASFNRMSERLARSEEEVEHTRAGLTRKNQELEERRAPHGDGARDRRHRRAGGRRRGHAHRAERRGLPPARPATPPMVGPARSRTRCTGPGRDEIVGAGAARCSPAASARQEREMRVPGARAATGTWR